MKTQLELLYHSIVSSEGYKDFCVNKKMIVLGVSDSNRTSYYPLHSSVLLDNKTSFEEYYTEITEYIKKHWINHYEPVVSDRLMVIVTNCDKLENEAMKLDRKNKIVGSTKNVRSYSTMIEKSNETPIIQPKPKVNSFSIRPLRDKPLKKVKDFCCMDIETIILDKEANEHVPVAISTYSKDFQKLFLIDTDLLLKDKDKAVIQLFRNYLDFMLIQKEDQTIFAHNLGGYDGYFLYKNLIPAVSEIDDLNCLLDESNKFIAIKYINESCFLTWKDSLRIFPGSLEELCKQFDVDGKLSKYKMEYNSIDLFTNPNLLEEFKSYSMQDSIALYNALINAQKLYASGYNVDICDVVSTASLAFKIFRKKFLKKEIPLLTSYQDSFVREAYIGGATDYYIAKGENLHHYDVNSLYPYAMLEHVPYKVIAKHNDLSGVNVKDFKGFVLAKVTCPDNIRNPIVALKHEGKTIYPKGIWHGVYFSDYLAKAQTYGYKIELINGIEFEYADLFSEYIKHFYEIKKTSKGSLKYLAKLKLNSLYGMFGRKKISLETHNIKNDELVDYLNIKIVKNIIDYDNGYSTIVCEKQPDYKLIEKLNIKFETKFKQFEDQVKSNVAIAAAITSYAQMKMMDYKNHPDFRVYYTDTDSLFTDKPLPDYLVGKELGQMKNETLDKYGVETIDEAIFVGMKKYGLRVVDKNGNIIESSTFAGVPKDSLTFEEVNQIHKGIAIVRKLKDRFSKSFNSLSIKTQTNVKLEISNKRDKFLLNNEYLPKTVNLSENTNFDSKLIDKLVKRYNRIKKKLT